MELALLVAGSKRDLEKKQLLLQHPRHHEEAFDSEVKMMATIHHGVGERGCFSLCGQGGGRASAGSLQPDYRAGRVWCLWMMAQESLA